MGITLLNVAVHDSIMRAKTTKIMLLINSNIKGNLSMVEAKQAIINDYPAELEERFATLKQLSERIKHLQLCKIDYDKTFESYRKHALKKHNLSTEDNVIDIDDMEIESYYHSQVTRNLIEILSHIVSLRDMLKINFYATCSNDNIKGFLQDSFININPQHKKLFKHTIGSKENATLRDFTTYFRNELLHNDLHLNQFLIMAMNSKEEAILDIFLTCDFNKFKSNNTTRLSKILFELSGKYLLDTEILPIKLKLSSEWFIKDFRDSIYTRALNVPEAHNAILAHLSRLEGITGSTEILEAYNQFGFDLIQIPNFLMYYIKLEENRGIESDSCTYTRKSEIPENIKLYFNLGEALEDIYTLHFNYYSQVHQLIFNYVLNDIESFILRSGISKDYFYSKYNYKLPKVIKI